jgi:AI-2 transport protein TqsA
MTGEWGERAATVLIAAIVILAAAVYARSFLAPIAFALFIAAIVWPLQSLLQKAMPRIAALGVVTAVIVIVFLLFGALIAWSFGSVGRGVINDAAKFQAGSRITALRSPASGRSISMRAG